MSSSLVSVRGEIRLCATGGLSSQSLISSDDRTESSPLLKDIWARSVGDFLGAKVTLLPLLLVPAAPAATTVFSEAVRLGGSGIGDVEERPRLSSRKEVRLGLRL